MNVFNRVALLILAAALLVYCCAGAVVAAGGIATQSIPGVSWLYKPLAPFAGLSGGAAIAAFAVCAVLILLALALLVAEVVSNGQQHSALTLLDDGSGRVTLDRRVVRDLAQHEARTVFGVIDCWIDVRTEHGSLVLTGRLTVDRYANLFDASTAVRDHVKQSVERSLGQTVSEIRLRCAAGSPRRRPAISIARSRFVRSLENRPVRPLGKGDLLVQMHPLQLIERAGTVMSSVAAALAIILGIIVIAYPIVLAWAVGIVLMLGGIAVFVTLYTVHAEEGPKSASDGVLTHQQDAR
ncbi:MAG TPA: DUF308 domain-containing protein [Dehalococcoidia bacterium]|nr:DUF308 domain-containing protein [Dehalococcoidia bacterium]